MKWIKQWFLGLLTLKSREGPCPVSPIQEAQGTVMESGKGTVFNDSIVRTGNPEEWSMDKLWAGPKEDCLNVRL